MNCRDVRRWISPYLDSELDQTKTFEISEHLRVCDACAERFEKERRVDSLLVERLEAVPQLDWNAITRRVLGGRRRIAWAAGLTGLAACAVVAIIVASNPGPSDRSAEPSWFTDAFVAAAPDGALFVGVAQAGPKLATVTRQALGVAVELPPAAELAGGHSYQLVDLRRRTGPDGTPYVEVRLNCCGEPVLMALALRRDAGSFGEFVLASDETVRTRPVGDVKLSSFVRGDIVVIAASHHVVEELVSQVRLKAA